MSSESQFTMTSLLHITDVETEDLSSYNCTASNDHGVDSVIITLSRRGLSIVYTLSRVG